MGGLSTRFRTDYEWPASIDTEAENANCGGFAGDRLLFPCFNLRYPEYEEQRRHSFLMQPGVGLDVRVQQRLKVRLLTDLLALANRERGHGPLAPDVDPRCRRVLSTGSAPRSGSG